MRLSRVLVDDDRTVLLRLDGATLVERRDGTRGARARGASVVCSTPLEALVSLHRRAAALTSAGMVEDTSRSEGEIRLSPPLHGIAIDLPLGRSEVERRLGELFTAHGASALPHAAPLLFLRWPVGYRFASLFEARPLDRGGKAAVARAIAGLVGADAASASELFRVALVQRNREALAPALALLSRARSFDTWMDVLELADDVGDRRHVAALRELCKGRVPVDAREPLVEITRELGRRR